MAKRFHLTFIAQSAVLLAEYSLIDYWRHYTSGEGWLHDRTKDRKRYSVNGQWMHTSESRPIN